MTAMTPEAINATGDVLVRATSLDHAADSPGNGVCRVPEETKTSTVVATPKATVASPKETSSSELDEVYVLPASAAQEGFWFLDQVQPGNTAYNIAIRFRLTGPLDVKNLQRAINRIVKRHESLRTTFSNQDGTPVQVVCSRLVATLLRDDLSHLPAADRRSRADELAKEEAILPFDLSRGPLFRVRLLRLDEHDHVLMATFHHAIADGWSTGVFLEELASLYDAICRGVEPKALSNLPIQYGDYAVWQQQWLASSELRDQLAYWTRQLASVPVLEVPPDRPRPPIQTFRGAMESILLPKALTDGLAALANRERATPFMVMLAAFQVLLHQQTGQYDIAVGSVLAGRSRLELEPIIGPFINTVVLRADLSGDPTFVAFLAQVRETVLNAFAHQDVPFGRVVNAVQPKRDPSRHPLFQVNFLHQRAFLKPFDVYGLTITPIPSLSPGSIYDLNCFLVERAEGWRASLEYNADLYDAKTIHQLLAVYRGLLEQISLDTSRRISQFPSSLVVNSGSESTSTSLPPSRLITPEAPRDSIEATLIKLWKRLLGTDAFGIRDDFFDIGGHSLLAARLIAEIEKEFGRRLSLPLLLEAPTIEALAIRLSSQLESMNLWQEKWDDPLEQVFSFRRQGSRPPLFLVDAGPFHRPLVRHLGDCQPVFGIALPKSSSLPERFTVKDIATNLVKALCASAPGPYYLAGWSNAGVIAFEMAQQLIDQGKEVAAVILLDTTNPRYVRRLREWKRYPIRLFFRIEKLFHILGRARRLGFRNVWRDLRERKKLYDLNLTGTSQCLVEPHGEAAEDAPLISWKALYRTAIDYSPAKSPFPLVLFRSTVLQTGRFRDPYLGWSDVAGAGIHVHEMPGEHDTMFREPVVQLFAKKLTSSLESVRNLEHSLHFSEGVQ